MSKVAFIMGITGQDGAYLAELLLVIRHVIKDAHNSIVNVDNLNGAPRPCVQR